MGNNLAAGASAKAPSPSVTSRETKLITAEAALANLSVSISDKPSYESLLIGGFRGTSTRCLSLCFGKCLKSSRRLGLLSLNFELRDELRLAVALTRCPFNNSNPVQLQILQTIYKQLTGDIFDCPRYGSHWERIGFQGNDPSTDLRGVGLLGLVHPLFLLTTPELFPFAMDVYRISLSEAQEFPLMVLSINLTRIAYSALKDGLLTRLCNEDGDLWHAFNLFYCAVVFDYYHMWKTQRKTIKDSGYVLKDVEYKCRKNVRATVSALREHLNRAYTDDERQRARQNLKKRM